MSSRQVEPRYVKTADLRPGETTRGWTFCGNCYRGDMAGGRTTDKDGKVCERCDGAGTLWVVHREVEPT